MNNLITKMAKLQSKFKAWLFALVCLDSRKMFWFWASVLFFQQFISASIEYVVWGELFTNWADPLFTGLIAGLYFHYQGEMGKLLLSIILNDDKSMLIKGNDNE